MPRAKSYKVKDLRREQSWSQTARDQKAPDGDKELRM
jgi:hypothetical protein